MTSPLTFDQLTEASLQSLGLEDAPKALRLLHELAGQGVTDDDLEPLLPSLLNALQECPDPDRALGSFARWFASVPNRFSHLQTLLRHTVALDIFCLVAGCSQYFADLLARHPEYFEIIANPGVRGGTKSAAALLREVTTLLDACQRPELKRDVLRRWKAREMLRIGVRDLIGLSDMPATAREFSNLADACVQAAYVIALQICEAPRTGVQVFGYSGVQDTPTPNAQRPTPNAFPFAVIGMGKLGGRELNYSSDIDLMFVHGDNLPMEIVRADGRPIDTTTFLTRVAETLMKVLTEESANGHVFRVDMRLRPEGRFGPLIRSLASYRAYYESWAESWERQALLKARFVAGDRTLGAAFMAMVEPFVYRRHVTTTFLEDIRHNKRRIEQKCALEGETDLNVKTGYGGIRDVEFLVQLLQLECGGTRPHLRTPSTLAALNRLRQAGLLTEGEADTLQEDYRFLRNLEHRLQLLHSFQTQTLPPPEQASERGKVARRMGFASREAFEKEWQARRDRLHGHLERLFYGRTGQEPPLLTTEPEWRDLNDLLNNIESEAARKPLTERLQKVGFRDIPNALRALQLPMRGNEFGEMPPDTPLEFTRIAPRLLSLLTRCADPDAGLAGIEALALAVPNRAQLYAAFDDSPEMMARLVTLSAAAPPLLKRLTRRLEWLESLFDSEDEEAEGETTAASLTQELAERLRGLRKPEARMEAIARFYLRETLRIGARDVWDEADASETMLALTHLAEATLQVLLDTVRAEIVAAHTEPDFAAQVLSRVSIVGLGKLGGVELGYSSDWDVLFVYDDRRAPETEARGPERFAVASQLVERFLAAGSALAAQGTGIEIDLRLRPWGRKGALIHSLRGFADYFRTTAETWERQAALKARWVAGHPHVGGRLVRLLQAVSFGRGVTKEEDAAVQAMKRRIESERLKSEERETDLKLGNGGLSDIEWLAQRLQMRHGGTGRLLRTPNTLSTLSQLASLHLLDNAEADALIHTYALLTRLRNGLWLLTGQAHDALPPNPTVRRALARRFGYRDEGETTAEQRLWEDVHTAMQDSRRIFQRRFFSES